MNEKRVLSNRGVTQLKIKINFYNPTVEDVVDCIKGLNYFLNTLLFIFHHIAFNSGAAKCIDDLTYKQISTAIKSRDKNEIKRLYPFIEKRAYISNTIIPNIKIVINTIDLVNIYLINIRTFVKEIKGWIIDDSIMYDIYDKLNLLEKSVRNLGPVGVTQYHKFIEEKIIL